MKYILLIALLFTLPIVSMNDAQEQTTRKKLREDGAKCGTAIGFVGGMGSLLWILPTTATVTKSAIANLFIFTTVGTMSVLGVPCLCGALGCLIGDGIWHYQSTRNNNAHDIENPDIT